MPQCFACKQASKQFIFSWDCSLIVNLSVESCLYDITALMQPKIPSGRKWRYLDKRATGKKHIFTCGTRFDFLLHILHPLYSPFQALVHGSINKQIRLLWVSMRFCEMIWWVDDDWLESKQCRWFGTSAVGDGAVWTYSQHVRRNQSNCSRCTCVDYILLW